jgi:hypothetical protein
MRPAIIGGLLGLTGVQLGGAALALIAAAYLWKLRTVGGAIQAALGSGVSVLIGVLVVIGVLGVAGYASLDVGALATDAAAAVSAAVDAATGRALDRLARVVEEVRV